MASRFNLKSLSWTKLLTVMILASVTTAGIVFGSQALFKQNRDKAQAAGAPLQMKPGDTGLFTIDYFDGEDDLQDALLKVYIGKELVLNENSIKDTFNGGTQYAVTPTVINKTDSTWGYVIEYFPGSANNPNAPSGSKQPATLAKNIFGQLEFQAQLKSDITTRINPKTRTNYKAGDTLDPVFNSQGIYSILDSTNAVNTYDDSKSIMLVLSSSSSSSSSSSVVSSTSSSSQQSSSQVSSGSVSSVSSNSSSSSNGGTVYSCPCQFDGNNRLYFVSKDNEPLNWDPVTKFNIGYPSTQKYKDGKVTLVFDKITRNDGNLYPDGSACKFELFRYTKNVVLKTYNTTVSGGKCQADFPVNDQTVNYYSVVATATDSTDGQIMKGMDRLVLIVGGDGNRDGGTIEI